MKHMASKGYNMDTSCKELKRSARENLNQRYGIPMLAFVITTVVTTLLQIPFSSLLDEYATMVQISISYIADFIIAVLTCMLTFGLCKIHLNIARNEEFNLKQMFYCYFDDVQRYLLLSLIMTILTVVSKLPFTIGFNYFLLDVCLKRLLIFGGLSLFALLLVAIVQVEFRLVYYVSLDNPTMGVIATIRQACALMHGCHGRLLHLYISFAGMALLALVSFGLGWLWVEPYMMQAITRFYQEAIGEPRPTTSASEARQTQYYTV